jgi:hypothetical protein
MDGSKPMKVSTGDETMPETDQNQQEKRNGLPGASL